MVVSDGGGSPALLERAVFEDPEDRDAWAVYADWLAGRGDPRGELIGLELRIEADRLAGVASSPDVATRYADLAHAGPARWAGAALSQLLATRDISRELALEWRRGYPYLARIAANSPARTSELLEAVIACDSIAFLNQLELRFSVDRDDPRRLGGEAFTARELASLRELTVDVWTFAPAHAGLVELDFDWSRSLPRLAVLRLLSPYLRLPDPPAFAHPSLRTLVISHRRGFERQPLEQLAGARLPALDGLHIFVGRIDEADRADAPALVLRALQNPLLGRAAGLRSLTLAASSFGPSLFAELADTRLARELVELSLAWGTIGDEHLPALRALIDAAQRLERLDLTYNYLSDAAVAELRRACRGRLLAADQKPDRGDRQLPVFGRYGVDDRRLDRP